MEVQKPERLEVIALRMAEVTERPPQRGRGGLLRRFPALRVAVEILLATVCATLVSGVLQVAAGRLDVPMPSHMPAAIVSVLSLLIVLVLVGVVSAGWRRWPLPATVAVWIGLAAFTTVALAVPLQGTQYYFGGISMDQSFRTQYLTRLTDSVFLLDMNYVDTAPYYPPGWFWLGGRFANLMGLDGWEAYKPWALLSMAVVSTLSFSLWSLVTRRPTAALLALATALVGLGVGTVQQHAWPFADTVLPLDVVPMGAGTTEPYAWLLGGLLPPVAVIALKAFSRGLLIPEGRSGGRRAALVGAGVFLGVSGAVYTLYFALASLLFVALAMTVFLQARRSHGFAAFWTLFARLAIIGSVALPFVLLVWTPYLVQAFTEGWPGTAAAFRFLPQVGAVLPFPMLEFSVLGLVSLIGFGWLLLRFKSNDIARAVGVLVLVCYTWFVLSTMAFAADTTLLPFRLRSPLTVALVCAGLLAALEAAPVILRRVSSDARRAVTIAICLLGVIVVVSVAQSVPQVHRDSLFAAHKDYYPTGMNAFGEQDRAHAGAWYDEVHETILAQTERSPEELVVLTNHYGLLVLYPYWGFQQVTAHYANPLADYDGRLAEIERWAEAADSAEFIARLDGSPYRPPAVFVLAEHGDVYRLTLTRDDFPRQPNIERFDVAFDKRLFSEELFSRSQVGPFVVLVRR